MRKAREWLDRIASVDTRNAIIAWFQQRREEHAASAFATLISRVRRVHLARLRLRLKKVRLRARFVIRGSLARNLSSYVKGPRSRGPFSILLLGAQGFHGLDRCCASRRNKDGSESREHQHDYAD